jgi:hypothetical protein
MLLSLIIGGINALFDYLKKISGTAITYEKLYKPIQKIFARSVGLILALLFLERHELGTVTKDLERLNSSVYMSDFW